MKIHWVSNAPWASTGYGNQTALFLPRLQALGHEMSVTAFYGLEGGVLTVPGPRGPIPVYPRGRAPYGQDIWSANAKHAGAEMVISLIDAWVWGAEQNTAGMPWCPWFPVDCEPLPKPIINKIKQAHARIVFSKHAVKQVNNAGLDCHYVPHGIDTDLFRPYDMGESRKALGFPADAFLVGMVAANKGTPSRKAFQPQLEAFAAFKRRHTDAILYIHTVRGENGEDQGMNLPEFCRFVGLVEGRDVLFADQHMLHLGFPPVAMANMYSAFDVHMLVSMGEGFGIPIVEAQSCGCPVIVGDWTAMSELCFGGWKVGKDEAVPFWTPLGMYQYWPLAGAVLERLEAAYEMRGNQDYRKRARDGALHYDADKVAEKFWKPVLDAIAASLEDKPLKVREVAGHVHTWIKVGLFNPDGTMSVPCKTCGAELVVSKDGQQHVIEGGFENPDGLQFEQPDGLEWLLLRETNRDYGADSLDLCKDSVVVDIGAHVGMVSITLAKRYGCGVFAFEPNPDNYKRLVANVEKNGVSGLVRCYNMAVTGDGRKAVIGVDTDNSGGNSIYGKNGVDVDSITAADILQICGGGQIDLLKIDCEGAEFEILKDPDLLKCVAALRGEFHRHAGDADVLLEFVKQHIQDVKVTVQG